MRCFLCCLCVLGIESQALAAPKISESSSSLFPIVEGHPFSTSWMKEMQNREWGAADSGGLFRAFGWLRREMPPKLYAQWEYFHMTQNLDGFGDRKLGEIFRVFSLWDREMPPRIGRNVAAFICPTKGL